MARALVFVPPSRAVLQGATPIGPGYAKGNTPAQMQQWAADAGRLYQTHEADMHRTPEQQQLGQWLTRPSDQLPPEARSVKASYKNLIDDPGQGIRGDLRPDGRVDLAEGRHRAHYFIERGTDPVPVWVSSPDAAKLEKFRSDCHESVSRSRPDIMNVERLSERGLAQTRPGAGIGRVDGAANQPRPRPAEEPAVRLAAERQREER